MNTSRLGRSVRRASLSATVVALVAATCTPSLLSSADAAAAAAASRLPYDVNASLPAYRSSPPVAKDAPYTPLVRNLIKQLEPNNPPTAAQLANAARLFQGLIAVNPQDSSCHGVGTVGAPTGTTPSIASLCWADSVGVNIVGGPNANRTTATAEPLALGASFDRQLSNAWGQVEGAEGRRTMVTGLYGPEADVSVQPNWERGLDTLGEDPYLNDVLAAAQVDGIQSRGLMAQVKHFAGFSGANRYTLTQVGDQALHEILFAPFESSFTKAHAASTMCAYEQYQDTSATLPAPRNALYPASPYATTAADKSTKTWPLNEAHWACEQPLALNYVLRWLWHSDAFVGSDYPAIHSTASMTQGAAQEFLYPAFFGPQDPVAPSVTIVPHDPTGDTCVNGPTAVPTACSSSTARHIGGLAGASCDPVNGCGLVTGVMSGALPLAVFNQALAEILYEEERFGLLGCNDSPRARTCTNPGGINGDRSGNAVLPRGPGSGASAARSLGTENGDAQVVERAAEEGAVLLKDVDASLPLTPAVTRKGIAVSGAGAEWLVAAPSNEASVGFADRDAISPLRQLKALSAKGSRIGFSPANDPTGYPVPSRELSTQAGKADGGLARTAGAGSPRKDPTLDFTTVSPQKPLAPGDYTWSGYVYAPRPDTYTFRFQSTPGTSSSTPVTFSLDGKNQTLSSASSFYCGQYYGHNVCVPVTTTNDAYTQGGLANQQTGALALAKGFHQVSISFRNDTNKAASFRFAYSRAAGDARDAAAAARGKAAAVVFVNDANVHVTDQDAYTPPTQGIASLPAAQLRLIRAVAAANPRTVVVLNTADPVVVKPWVDDRHVRGLLEMWNSGQEGGTATARLLLGLANPSGHTTVTWPKRATDTLWTYKQTHKLYAGDRTGVHPERLNGLSDNNANDCNSFVPPTSPCTRTVFSQGIYSGYRYYDKEGLAPQYPFGYGLSYTRFRFSALKLRRTHSGVDVTFSVSNAGQRSGTAVAQVYVGPGPARGGVQQAVRSLRAFERVVLRPGQTRRITLHLDGRSFQYWDSKTQRWTTDRGSRVIWVGDADTSSHLPAHGTVQII